MKQQQALSLPPFFWCEWTWELEESFGLLLPLKRTRSAVRKWCATFLWFCRPDFKKLNKTIIFKSTVFFTFKIALAFKVTIYGLQIIFIQMKTCGSVTLDVRWLIRIISRNWWQKNLRPFGIGRNSRNSWCRLLTIYNF